LGDEVSTMRHILCLSVLITLMGCVPGDNERAAPDAGVLEVRVCNLGAGVECTVDGERLPCGATEVEVAPDEVGHCTYTAIPACDALACEWTAECDVGGCTCIVGYPAGRLTACY
jgi:hypothetical protein